MIAARQFFGRSDMKAYMLPASDRNAERDGTCIGSRQVANDFSRSDRVFNKCYTRPAKGLPFRWVGATAHFAEQNGMNVRDQMVQAGVAPVITDDTILDPTAFLLMCALVINGIDDEMHGITPARMERGTASMLSKAMSSEKTLRDAIAVLVRFFRSVDALCDIQLTVKDELATIEVRTSGTDAHSSSIVEELMVHYFIHQFSYLIGFLLPLEMFTTRSISHPALYREHPYLLCPVWHGKVTALHFHASYLDMDCRSQAAECPLWDAQSFWVQLHPAVDVERSAWENRGSVSWYTYRLLLERNLSLEQCALQLGLSPTEMKRLLAAEGSSFRFVRRDALVRRVRPYLQSGMAIEDLAELLGYSEGRSIRRAIKLAGGGTIEELRLGSPAVQSDNNLNIFNELRQQAYRMQ